MKTFKSHFKSFLKFDSRISKIKYYSSKTAIHLLVRIHFYKM